MLLSVISLCIGAIWGVMFYYAVIHRVEWCAISCAVSFAVYEADRFYASEIVRGFIKGFTSN